MQLLEDKDMAMMELRTIRNELHDIQTKSNALAGGEEMKMAWYVSPLFDFMLALHGNVASAPHKAAKDW